jgi:hypothetical protein
MNWTRKILKAYFWTPIAIAVVCVVLFETDILIPGELQMSDQAQFMMLTIVELMTLAAIPLALYLFKMKRVKSQFVKRPAESLLRFGILRLMILGAGVVVNTLLYYMTMSVSYGYMSIILTIAMTFVYPSRQRCDGELGVENRKEE